MVDYKRLYDEKMEKDRARQRRWRDRKADEGKRTLSVMISPEVQEIIQQEIDRTGDSKEAIVYRAFMAYRDSISQDVTHNVKKDTGQEQIPLGLKEEPEPLPTDADQAILELYKRMGPSWRKMADELNRAGLRTVKGREWKDTNVRMRFNKLKGGA